MGNAIGRAAAVAAGGGRRGARPGIIRRSLAVLATGSAALLATGCAGSARPAPPGHPVTPSPSRPVIATPPVPQTFVPESFTAVSPTRWWVLGSAPCGSRDCPAIVTTSDGGATFQSRPAPGGPFGPGLNSPPAAGSIRFANSSDGWVFGPALYATHDGGRHWTAIPVPGQVTGLEPGLGEIFAVITPPLPRCARTGTCTSNASAPRLWRAQPSSDHWTADPTGGAVSTGLAVHGRSVWLINTMSTRDGPAIGTGLLHSADGGGHFTLEPEAIPGIACSYSPASDTVIWSYCSGGHLMDAYLSADAGAHFTAAGPSEPPQTTPNGYPGGSTLQAASPATAVAASDLPGSPLIRTSNGGRTWGAVQAPPDSSGTWSLIGFTTPEDGYAFWDHNGAAYQTSTGQLWHTTDSGTTWSPVTALP